MRFQLFCNTARIVTLMLAAGAEAQPAPQAQDCTGKAGVDWNKQIKACTAVIETAQGSPQDRAAIYKKRATAYYAVGDDDHAMADDDAAIRLDPNMAAAYSSRGDVYMDREDPDRAIAEYNEALQHDAKLVAAYTGRSAAYDQKGDFDRALADANAAIGLDAKSASAYETRGKAYVYKGDIERALADYDQAMRIDPKEAAEIYNLQGLAYMEKGDEPAPSLLSASRPQRSAGIRCVFQSRSCKSLCGRSAQGDRRLQTSGHDYPGLSLYAVMARHCRGARQDAEHAAASNCQSRHDEMAGAGHPHVSRPDDACRRACRR